MSIQPGTGLTFSSSSMGTTINIEQPLMTWDLGEAANVEPPNHPYKVINANSVNFQVVPGAFNNNPTLVDGTQGASPDWLTDSPPPTVAWNWNSSTNKSYVYLVAGPNPTTYVYPNPDSTASTYPSVGSWASPVTDSDSYGYLMLAEATLDAESFAVVVTQYVTGSIWADRLKLGDQTARYYYARV